MAGPVDLPMVGNARESVRNSALNSETTCGISFDTSENSAVADKLDRDGYETEGLNIRTGRSKKTRFSGAK